MAWHVEAQVLADTYGQVLVAGTRDCTLQRRYQKLVEEAPAPFLTDDQRDVLEHSAAAICRAAGYVSAGTVEFLLSAAGELSFLEVNTRLQVEHSATEETIDVDLVRAQLLIAAGHPLATAIARRMAPPGRPGTVPARATGPPPRSRPGGTPSNSGSTRRTPAMASLPRPARSPGSGSPAARESGSIPASRPAAS